MDDARIQRIASDAAKEQERADLLAMDKNALAKMSDTELAVWQSRFDEGSSQFILANHERDRRLLAKELKTVRWCSIVATAFGFGGVVLGAALTYYLK